MSRTRFQNTECGRPGHSHVRQPQSPGNFVRILADGSCCARGRAHSGCELLPLRNKDKDLFNDI